MGSVILWEIFRFLCSGRNGYSDDDIDTIFDGDPSAYWNIDKKIVLILYLAKKTKIKEYKYGYTGHGYKSMYFSYI